MYTNDYFILYLPNGMYLNKFITSPNPGIFNMIYNLQLPFIPFHYIFGIILSSHIIPVLSSIIDNSFNTVIFPNELKHRIISPILKNTTYSVEDFSSYRPISKLSIFSKIF